MKNKTLLIITILFLSIGFAAVSTTLYLTGVAKISTNEEEFDVYFSDAYVDGTENKKIISADKKVINFTTNPLSKVGDKSILEYEVTNASTQYDANVSVTCSPTETELYKVTDFIDKEIIEVRSIAKGSVTVELKKNVLEERKISFTCNLFVIALEKDSLDMGPIKERCEYPIGTEWTFEQKDEGQEFALPCTGSYKFELWGAGNPSGGAYTSGNLKAFKGETFYIYVGGQGASEDSTALGGYNGGGNTYMYAYRSGLGGAGATDIRLVGGLWNDFESLKSRIMVAAGSGGNNAPGGGLAGYNLYDITGNTYRANSGRGGGQTYGGAVPVMNSCARTNGTAGGFGYGGTGGASSATAKTGGGSGGGSGYYGGSGASGLCNGSFPGGGGSSFISGHDGCNAIDESSISSKIVHTGQPNHYSGVIFTKTKMIDGIGYNWTNVKGVYTGMPTHDGVGSIVSNEGNGFAKITLIK